jgi:hydrogenase maturation protease
MKTLVMGIGNLLLGDDGAGVHIVRNAARRIGPSDSIDFIDAGTLSFTLAARIGESDRLVVVDAAELGQPAGSVSLFIDDDMDSHLSRRRRTVHEVGLLDLMDMARLSGDLPGRRALLAVQPQSIDWSESLSEPVAAAVEPACERLEALFGFWDKGHVLPS